MKFKYKSPLLATFVTILLSACSNTSPEAIQETTTETSETHSELVSRLNNLFEQEANLQNNFNQTIEEDPSLGALSDESSVVYDNIDQRRSTLEEVDSLSSDLQNVSDTYINYSEEDFSQENVQSLGTNLLELTTSIDEYTTEYSTSLDNQESYFSDLTSDEADYQFMVDGIESINEEHSTLQESASTIDQQLVETGNQLNELQSQAEEIINGEGSQEAAGAVASDEGESSEATSDTSEEVEFQYQINQDNWLVEPLENSDANPQVALLTFDDAPDGNALQIAEDLNDKDAGAIFFVNGMYIQDEEGQEALKQIHDMGFEIGNHTQTHANLQTISEEQQTEEIIATSDLIEEVIGERPRFFRAPHGVNTDHSIQTAEDDGMTVMNWSYGYDWEPEYQDPEALADIMVNTELLNNGGNLLMHDRTWTAEAVPTIIDGLREKDYEIVDPSAIASIQDSPESEEAN